MKNLKNVYGDEMKNKYSQERGSKLLKVFDKYVGIPIVFLLGIFKIQKKIPMKIDKIALLKTAAIGDTTILTAIIKDIEEWDSNIKITLFTGSSNYEFAKLLIKQSKNLEVIKLPIKNPFKSIKIIRGKEFDVFLDFGTWPRLNALFSYFANSKIAVGFKTKNQYRHFTYDKCALHSSKVHELKNYKEIIKIIGIDKNNLPHINFLKNNKIDDTAITIHMFPGGSKSFLKEWPDEYWVEIINFITKNNNIVYLTGTKIDKDKSENIKKYCNNKDKIIITTGIYTLEETIELLSISILVISVNTGIMHLASALKSNLIALNGPTSNTRWGPLNSNSISLQSHLECSPCLNLGFEYGCNENKCMKSINTNNVIDAIRNFEIIKKI